MHGTRKIVLAFSMLFLRGGLSFAGTPTPREPAPEKLGEVVGTGRAQTGRGGASVARERPLPELSVFHRAGQTFVTWKEVGGEGVTYNLYRAGEPVTVDNLASSRLVATGIPQGSAHDFIADRVARFRARPSAGTQPATPPQNFIIHTKDGPLPQGTGLFVYTPNHNGVFFYALTAVWPEGGEDRRVRVGANSQLESVVEGVRTAGPVLITREEPAPPAPTAAGIEGAADHTEAPGQTGPRPAATGQGANPGEVRLDYLHWATPEQASVDGHPYRFRLVLKADDLPESRGPQAPERSETTSRGPQAPEKSDSARGASKPKEAEPRRGLGLIVRLHPYTGNYTMTTWTRPGFITLGLDDFTPSIDEQEHHSFWFGYPENLGHSYLTSDGPESASGGPSAPAGQQATGADAKVGGQAKGGEASPVPVRDYTQKRISWTIAGVMEHFPVDPNRIYLTGSSMGGTGTVDFGLRHPELFAALDAVVPLINPARSKAWGHNLLGKLWGSEVWPTLPDGEGHTLGERLDDTAYVLAASADLPLLKFFNARQDTAIGWTQIPEFIQALQQAHQPFLSAWDNGGHGGPRAEVTQSFKDFDVCSIPRNQCVPALSNASTADDPGTGAPAAGDPVGAINDDFRWDVEKDTATELVLRLWRVPKSGKSALVTEATVDVTPRRRQTFHPRPGSKVTFQNSPAGAAAPEAGAALQETTITVEPTGLFTARQVRVGLEPGSRLRFTTSPAPDLAGAK